MFSYHILKQSTWDFAASSRLVRSISKVDGVRHAEALRAMQVGAPVFSWKRYFSKVRFVFIQWKDEHAFETFLQTHALGQKMAKQWYVKLALVQCFGTLLGFEPIKSDWMLTDSEPVVSITWARMKAVQIPRFLRWGIPVEKEIRDHEGTLLTLAGIHYPQVISTFSMWKNQTYLNQLVQRPNNAASFNRHTVTMQQNVHKSFYTSFATLRFKLLGEFGTFNGKSDYAKCNEEWL